MSSRIGISPHIRKAVIERDGSKCIICGLTAPLEIAHIIPLVAGGKHTVDNLVTLCANCHYRLDSGRISNYEFESFIERVLSTSEKYTHVIREFKIPNSKSRVDIAAYYEESIPIFIEAKAVFAFVNERLNDAIQQLRYYSQQLPEARGVLASLGELNDAQMDRLHKEGFKYWGPSYFVNQFSEELEQLRDDFFSIWFRRVAKSKFSASTHISFEQQLTDCKPGRQDWSKYQRLIGNLLEELLVPPLEKPIAESPDGYKVNRRDFVIPNYCIDGFWYFMRERYDADYIVVDAKNYSKQITKKEILQIANYLKKHGTGLFAIIFSRNGTDSGAEFTLREQWALFGKMILVLDDSDVLAMISAASSGGNPDTVIRQRIEEFRLKM
ncbi:MAG: HNH endonuclease [Anaerolineales bacterium]|nr:HNH endonuclease [Anaerolineales bacterium]MCA9931780.1 HNH endonuclease [Anaerolineales bacterium]